MSCYSKGVACSFNDDFNELAPLVEEADMIVFATPLYWFTFPMQLKAAIDKFFAFLIGKRTLKIQSCALLVCSGAPNEDGFDAIKATYKQIANHMNWSDSGIISVPVCFPLSQTVLN